MSKYINMVVCAAEVLSQRQAKAYGDHPETYWGIFGNDLIEDAQAMLEAVGAPDLLYALESIVEMNPELPMGMIEAAKEAIAKARSEE